MGRMGIGVMERMGMGVMGEMGVMERMGMGERGRRGRRGMGREKGGEGWTRMGSGLRGAGRAGGDGVRLGSC
jgi:hypothetical protein